MKMQVPGADNLHAYVVAIESKHLIQLNGMHTRLVGFGRGAVRESSSSGAREVPCRRLREKEEVITVKEEDPAAPVHLQHRHSPHDAEHRSGIARHESQ